MNKERAYARNLAKQYNDRGEPTKWFEVLYFEAKSGKAAIPWADLKANPNLVQWLNVNEIQGEGKTALKVGCGLGDDVEELCRRGFNVIGFDISPSAIEWCRNRFPNSTAKYIVTDLLNAPSKWNQSFDFVLESYTLQVLPSSLRQKAISQIASFVASGGQLLVVSRGRDNTDDPGQMPYPLTKNEIMQFVETGLILINFEDYFDEESPPVRRFRAEFKRGSAA
ncbi:class I SAM-dependent methyltransferase [Microcoleus sp. FACHB-672]|uniref:class I SAM-dependent methyltransferase n=1 Tax=Microcoleus sp. FACHB-672 TaxID=2692825 RepID=UPI001682D29E|nr:class I SAM-dependent methyltransferase [Microcoleus sp. FACHB-672]MBD2043405.1 class I SAM-dependent methyltransferase [Microcoleus sp. FACHB-672]